MAEEAGAPGAESGEKPEKSFTQEQVEALIKDRVTRERKSLRTDLMTQLRTELLVDEEFRRQALKEWKVEPDKGAKVKPDDDTVKELFSTWEKEHLEPVRSKATQLEKDVEGMRRSSLESDILAEAGGKVPKGLLKKTANGHSALFNMMEPDFEYDEESRSWHVCGKDGPRPSPGGERLYMTPEERVAEWLADPDNKAFVLDGTQSGADFKGKKDGEGKRVYSRDEYSRLTKDEAYYAKNRDELLAAVHEGRVR